MDRLTRPGDFLEESSDLLVCLPEQNGLATEKAKLPNQDAMARGSPVDKVMTMKRLFLRTRRVCVLEESSGRFVVPQLGRSGLSTEIAAS